MKKSLFILILSVTVLLSGSFAQTDTLLDRLLKGKGDLTEVMNTVKAYYRNAETKNRLGADAVNRSIKHWMRFEWYMSNRLGDQGEFVNITRKLYEATGITSRAVSGSGGNGNIVAGSSGSWTPVGPMNTDNGIGRVDRLAFHPTDANTVYAGTTAGGLWRTTDAGANWTNLSPDLPSGGISGIVIDPVNPNTIYLLTGDGDSNFGGFVQDFDYIRLSIGVLKSTNGGTNWTKTGDFPGVDYSNLTGYRLIMHPSDNNILYACTNKGIFMTVNAGTSWGLVIGDGRFFNMKFKPGSGNICYATGAQSDFSTSYFFRSTNSGLSWDTVNSVTPQINNPTRRVELAIAPSKPNRVYLLAGGVPGNGPGNPIPNRFKGVYLSDDAGLNFSLQTNSPNILGRATNGQDIVEQSNYDLAIAVSNTNSNTLVTGAVQVWNSLDSGQSFTYRGDLKDDIHDLGYHPVGNKLWVATDGGVFSSTNHGATWTSHLEDMNITQFYRMAVDPDDYNNLIGGAQDNAVKRKTGATSYFDQIFCCDGFTVGYDAVTSTTVYAVNNQVINRSVDGGNTFNSITPPLSGQPFAMSMAVHTSLANALFIGSDSIWRSTDGGANWSISPNIQAGWFMRTCPSNGNRIYAAGGAAYNSTSGILRRSDDGGVTWTNNNILSNDPGFPSNFTKITSINVDPTNSLKVWVTFGGFTSNLKVYYCDYNVSPAGNWINMSGSLPNVPVNCIALDNANNAYIGTDNGVYYRGNGMSDWVPYYNNLPYVPVTDLIISEPDNRIRAATFGRGIWSSDLYSTCDINLNITGTLEGQEFYEASNSVTSTASLLTSVGTRVQMRGGNEVLLQAGFTAKENTEFRALIGPCGSGGVAGFRLPAGDTAYRLSPKQYLPPPGGPKVMIHIQPDLNGQIRFTIEQKKAGEMEFFLTNETGVILRSEKIPATQPGKWNRLISTAGLTPGKYYLQGVLDKRVEHLQELSIEKIAAE